MQSSRLVFVIQLCLVIAFLSGCPPEDDPGTNTDAGQNDAGQNDAGQNDAGQDTSTPDMGGADSATGCVAAGCPTDRYCDESSGECVGCLDASHCTDPAAPVCRDGACAGCEDDDECTDDEAAYCGPDGACVSCTSDDHCPGENPFCDDGNTCRQCADSSDCPTTAPACVDGSCETCSDAECGPDELRRAVAGEFCRNGVILEGRYEDIPTVERGVQATQAMMCTGDVSYDPALQKLIFDGLADGRIAIDEAALEGCHMSQDRAGCGATDLLVPQVDDGGACLSNLDCISGVCDETTCPGTCAARGAVGDSCAADSACRTSLTCIAGSCAELPPLGEACETMCAEGWCDQGTCVVRQPAGESCTSNTQCESLRCDQDTNVCLEVSAAGEECISFVCEGGGRCWEGICQAPQPVGSACDVTAQCAPGLRCVDQACVQILLPGEACEESRQCARGTACIGGRCRALPALGEACTEATGCLRGTCDADSAVCVNLPAGTVCAEQTYPNDLFDPCGDIATCVDAGGTYECVADVTEGEACGSSVAAQCEADTSCERNMDDALVCQAMCTADDL